MKKGKVAVALAAAVVVSTTLLVASPAAADSHSVGALSCADTSFRVTIYSYALGNGNHLHQKNSSTSKLYEFIASGTYPTWHKSAYYQSITAGGVYSAGPMYQYFRQCEIPG